ncbi:MAG: 3-oxoacyl-ACP synthase III [Fuerstiella sp.]|jgi:3-oxoacyl-[acyl-carrier-protein] synthase-3|nr:3-oxoacyl-ACP synthase III [Fuerstiella sp.]MCP4507249.1 3-oxoacyl-ACP synthase III [Fuerstiella sp.]MDG2129220.1 3-oxoacyl-ACP synthase III [Fuerstiella sp.]
MRYKNVCVEAVVHRLPPDVVTSDDIERQLAPVYERLNLPFGRLQLMTGIQERRFFDRGTLPGQVSVQAANDAVEASGVPREKFGALIHGSVCRDQMEPATAAGVHAGAGLPDDSLVMDVSNACLGLLNGMLVVADLIELGRISAGVIVGTETGRGLVEGTIDSLLKDKTLTRKSIKSAFASLTIGSGSAAIVLCHSSLSQTAHNLVGGAFLSDTSRHDLCAGGVAADIHGDSRPRMETDSEGLLRAGIALAERTWKKMKHEVSWTNDDVDRVFTHQVGKQHRALLLEKLQLAPHLDFPTVERFGNTGAAALPMALAMGLEQNPPAAGTKLAMLGIGSGLNSVMLGIECGTGR